MRAGLIGLGTPADMRVAAIAATGGRVTLPGVSGGTATKACSFAESPSHGGPCALPARAAQIEAIRKAGRSGRTKRPEPCDG